MALFAILFSWAGMAWNLACVCVRIGRRVEGEGLGNLEIIYHRQLRSELIRACLHRKSGNWS
jgi:hypothetical protein